jgi:hypothetical protein
VIIGDMNYYPVTPYHFDLNGTAFGAMAKEDRNDELRHSGIIGIQFRRYGVLFLIFLATYIPLPLFLSLPLLGSVTVTNVTRCLPRFRSFHL